MCMFLLLTGGTVDITVHEVVAGGHLKELHKASGGAWGGTQVDDAFYQFLVRLFGKFTYTPLFLSCCHCMLSEPYHNPDK